MCTWRSLLTGSAGFALRGAHSPSETDEAALGPRSKETYRRGKVYAMPTGRSSVDRDLIIGGLRGQWERGSLTHRLCFSKIPTFLSLLSGDSTTTVRVAWTSFGINLMIGRSANSSNTLCRGRSWSNLTNGARAPAAPAAPHPGPATPAPVSCAPQNGNLGHCLGVFGSQRSRTRNFT